MEGKLEALAIELDLRPNHVVVVVSQTSLHDDSTTCYTYTSSILSCSFGTSSQRTPWPPRSPWGSSSVDLPCRESVPVPNTVYIGVNVFSLAFTSRPIIYTTAAFAFLVGLNAFGLFDVNEKHPITQYMTDKIASNESILQENLDHIEVVKEEAADYRLRMSAKLDTFKPIKNTGYVRVFSALRRIDVPSLIAMGSPHGIAVKPREDMTDIKTRPYRNQ